MIHQLDKRVSTQHSQAIASRQKSAEYISKRPQTEHYKNLALAELKKSKVAESTITKSMKYKLQLETLLENIESAHDNLEMTRIMENSLPVLEQLNKRVGGADKVADLVEQVQQQAAETAEIGRIINEATTGQVDEEDIEDEYARLLKEESGQNTEERAEVSGEDLADLLAKATLQDVPDIEDRVDDSKVKKEELKPAAVEN